MTYDRIHLAVVEAKRFLTRAEYFRAHNTNLSVDSSKESGALRRASMDLTRALAEMRRP